jgi:hypothetical protein
LTLLLQACEQLNAWIGGFQPILNRMTPNNFKWFLHSLLFIHKQRVIKAQKDKARKQQEGENDDDDERDAEGIAIDRDE